MKNCPRGSLAYFVLQRHPVVQARRPQHDALSQAGRECARDAIVSEVVRLRRPS
jgi:hypothetical protein